MSAAYSLEPRAVYGDAPGGRVLLYLPGSAEGLRWHPLSEIEKLAVIGPDGGMALPCGACMEFMMQLGKTAGEIEILVDEKRRETRRLKELIPSWWGAGHSM